MCHSSGAFFRLPANPGIQGLVGTYRAQTQGSRGGEGVTGTAHSPDASPMGRLAICSFYARGGGGAFSHRFAQDVLGGWASSRLRPRQPSLPARVHCLTAPPPDAAHMTAAQARGPRSPEERLQPKELQRVPHVQAASAGRRALRTPT
ncbi:hypothetical protein NDU88_008024 [Pleurodeles waltl]|uniref:Uncharacterized protein n=1 Tax=Pleurodeles waltl TaxID=8319 RepID=A0AAV7QMD1_PLEWA|nr:hypothetical protein NDU88_008024 [Pleurodeles waltl]